MSRIISVVIGIALVLGAGTSVYLSKKPFVVPIEDNVQVTTDGAGKADKLAPTPAVTSNTEKGKQPGAGRERESEDEEDDGRVSAANPTPPPSTNMSPSQTQPSTGGISLAQIAQHNSRTSCWSAINGNVYDLTSWIPNHPGGEKAILSLCGIDGSAGYNGQHGGQSKPASILAGFKIGALAK